MYRNRNGLLLVVSGPSGVGKGTVCKALLERLETMRISISATTRPRRVNEIDGVNYFFKTQEEFEAMIDHGEFLEYIQVFGLNYYGTPKAYVEVERRNGHDILLEIDVKGAMKVKEVCPDAVTVFIAPPTMSDLKTRLYGRGTENEAAIERRYKEAFAEIQYLPKYDYVVVNDIVDRAAKNICDIIEAEKSSIKRNSELIAKYSEEMNEQ